MSKISELDKIDRAVLAALGENDEWCYPYRYLERMTGEDRATLKKHVTRLRELGYVKYYRGLMDEEGQVAGSGFGVVYEKWREIRDFIYNTPERQKIKLIDMLDDYKHGYVTREAVVSQVNAYVASLNGGMEKTEAKEAA